MKFFKYYIYIFILFLLLLLSPKTYALVNNDTTYEITMPNYSELLDFQCGDYNFKEELDNLLQNTDTDNLSFGFSIMNRLNNTPNGTIGNIDNIVDIYFYSKIYLFSNFSIFYQNNNYLAFKQTNLPFSSSYRVSHIAFYANSCNSLDNNTTWNTLKNALENNVIPTNDNNNYAFPFWWSYGYSNAGLDITNDMSYSATYWYYYTNYDLYYSYGNNQSTSNSDMYFKKLHIIDNDSYYTINSRSEDGALPSYVDIYGFGDNNVSTFIGYQDSLETFYTSLSPTDISNYQLKVNFKVPQSLLGFYQEPQEYIDNTTFDYICSGRLNNIDYYSYESFPCSLSSSYSITDSSIEYIFNQFSSTSSLSSYDKIYITIKSNYLDSSISTTIFNYSYTYNLGSFYNTEYKGSIYEDFVNLPLNFKAYFSSNNSLTDSLLYIRKYNFLNYNIRYVGFSNSTNKANLVIGKSILGSLGNEDTTYFVSTNVSNSIDTGILVFQDNGNLPLPSLDLFFNSGMIISFNNTSNSNDYYYIDNEGSIQNSDFVKPVRESSNKYDISYYMQQVNDFINDLSNDTLEFSYLTQSFYNSLPLFFQTFIFIIFILFCIYFIYLLIKR